VATTSVFAEILATGVQALIWIFVAVAACRGWSVHDVKCTMSALGDWSAWLGTAALAVAYSLGVMIDRLADSLLKPFHKEPENFGALRMNVMAADAPAVNDFLAYIRTRMRLMRNTTVNACITTVVAAAVVRKDGVAVIAALLIGGAVTALAAMAWLRIASAYEKRLTDAAKALGIPQELESSLPSHASSSHRP
jgi:hypothetical protein